MFRTFCAVFSCLTLIGLSSFADEKVVSQAKERSEVFITVYNRDLALIRDVRKIELKKGKLEVEFEDVTEKIMPETVVLKPLDKGALVVLEQNYEYDLLTPARLLNKYVGKGLSLVKENPKTGEEKRTEATLLSTEGGGVFRTPTGITFGEVGRLELRELPDNFVTHPTLRWVLDNGKTGVRNIETAYLTGGMSWKADYVMVLDDADKLADLNGWVTLNNESGASFDEAVLSLVAGDVNRVAGAPRQATHYATSPGVMGDKGFKEEGLFEYHLYTLDRPTTILDRQQKQVSLLEASGIKVKRLLKLKPRYTRLTNTFRSTDSDKQEIHVFVELLNSKKDGLGMPLPAGVVRVYKSDSRGGRQFLGEDSVVHTPVDEEVAIRVGSAFDVVAERRQVDYKRIADSVHQTSWEIKIRNHKKEKVTVEVEEPMAGDWEVLKSSHEATRIDASTLGFEIDVKPGGEAILEYLVQVKQ